MGKSAAPTPISTRAEPMFFGPDTVEWKRLLPTIDSGAEPAEKKRLEDAAQAAKTDLKAFLLSSLQMQHVVVLAGSGTSLGPKTKGPSMLTLWGYCINSNPDTGSATRTAAATKVISAVG